MLLALILFVMIFCWQGRTTNLQNKILESDIVLHIGQHESEFTMKLNCAAYYGDLHRLKRLVTAGADTSKTDYDGRSPLVSSRNLQQNSYKYRSQFYCFLIILGCTKKCINTWNHILLMMNFLSHVMCGYFTHFNTKSHMFALICYDPRNRIMDYWSDSYHYISWFTRLHHMICIFNETNLHNLVPFSLFR